MLSVMESEVRVDHYGAFRDPTELLDFIISPASPAAPRWCRSVWPTGGLVQGSRDGRKGGITALVDSDDIHCLMIGASGVGKTAYFLYPDLEYARA